MNARDPVAQPDSTGHLSARQRAQRVIALVEAAKGVGALAASIGLLGLLHHDLRHIVAVLIGHFGLDPGDRYPEELLHYATVLQDTSLRTLVALAAAYVILRLVEAYGLWRDRAWGEWLGALSGGIYVPFEMRHLLHQPGVLAAAVVLFNVAIVAFLAWQLRHRKRIAQAGY